MDSADRFSEIARSFQASEIRELMKLLGRPGLITFAGGMPDEEHFPHPEIISIIESLTPAQRAAAYQYGPTPGYPPLLEALSSYLLEKGIRCGSDNLIVTTGAQQALHLVARILLDPQDVVIVEDPSFIGAMNAFLSFRALLVGVPILSDGPDLERLEKAVKLHSSRLKFVYVIPNFQNPSGITYSLEKRRLLLEMAEKHDFLILEDDPYCELFFEGEETVYRSLKSMDDHERVIYLGTFSKTLAPGFRIGYAVASKTIKEKMELAKQSVDACSPSFSQVVAAEYLKRGLCAHYVASMRRVYHDKCRTMLDVLERELPSTVSFTRPKGGFFIWLTLPTGADARTVFQECVEHGVAFVTGAGFCIEAKGEERIRLAFSNASLMDIKKGTALLCSVLRKYYPPR
ncbi:MAG: hypothetical protein A2293_11640 [Elusimicrobia bacterium RIFOXYB2_FULL_49_7]|nr:MAG: hypothetical protein A2293_11640 [Elusimicrobia bacterium RIFOXYB2_FULL_49_7]